jgi:hypothetical protein
MSHNFKYLIRTTGKREISSNCFSVVTGNPEYKIKTMKELDNCHLYHSNSYEQFIHIRDILEEHEEQWCFQLGESIISIHILI